MARYMFVHMHGFAVRPALAAAGFCRLGAVAFSCESSGCHLTAV